MRILAAISGGVDSAVAAARLVAEGADVVGAHLRTGVEAEGESAGGARSCCGADDARDARAVAAKLGIPFYVIDVQAAFGRIIDEFVHDYREGRTPIPCIGCNKHVKFGRLREVAAGVGAGTVATGHYARVVTNDRGRVRLLRAVDKRKDQSYMLHQLSQEQLAAARFPLGNALKSDVRREAERLGLDVAWKRDSQELCFLPAGGPREFLRDRVPDAHVPGAFVDPDGNVLGEHRGAMGFTIGQRKGLPALGEPRYVSHVDPKMGRVTIVARAALMERAVLVRRVNWIDCPEPPAGARFEVEVRHRHAAPLRAAEAEVLGAGAIRVVLEEPVFAPTPGQALVAWQGEGVLFGGTIDAIGDAARVERSP